MSIEAEGEPSTEGSASPSGLSSEDARDLDRSPLHGLTGRAHLVQLLRTASSIEHALMVQYLFAAYSLNPQKGKDKDQQREIARWQNLLLSVAKEEMGHMLTVQNVLCLLGAPVELARDTPRRDSRFSPFPFKLERLTMDSLNSYMLAEMPAELPPPSSPLWFLFEKFIGYRESLPKDSGAPHVGDLYRNIIEIIADPERILNSDFHDDSFRFQASWEDWGRSHDYKIATHDEFNLATFMKLMIEGPAEPMRADVLIERAATRSQARDALTRISEQGEAAPTAFTGSHFQRFFSIRRNFESAMEDAKKNNATGWEPTHLVVDDPHTLMPNEKRRPRKSTITWPRSEKWANLFNLRYCMLLTYLSHAFQLARDGKQGTLRGAVIHKTFAEMYNLKAIAGILVRLPLKDPLDPCRAGPPFQMPKGLALGKSATDRWRLHRDLIKKALTLNNSLQRSKSDSSPEEISYLRAMEKLDRNSAAWTEKIIAGLGRGRNLSS